MNKEDTLLLGEIIRQMELQGLPLNIEASHVHLGVFVQPWLDAIRQGRKTVESRFSKNRMAPYHRISVADVVFVKESCGACLGWLELDGVEFFDLRETKLETLRLQYGAQLCVDEGFWQNKAASRYATLLFLREYHPLIPFNLHKHSRQTWLVLK